MAAKQKAFAEAWTGGGKQIAQLAVHGQRYMVHAKIDPAAVSMRRTTSLEILAGEHQNIWKSNTDVKVKLFSGLRTFHFT